MATDIPFRKGGPGAEQRGSSFSGEDRREEAPERLPSEPSCPFCDGHDTEIMSAFGAHSSVSAYWCRSCGSPFEMMKWSSASG